MAIRIAAGCYEGRRICQHGAVVAPPITAAGLRRLARGVALGGRAERRSLARETFFRVAERFTPALAAEHDGMRLFVSTHDRVVSVATFCGGPFELEYLERAVAALAAAGHELRGRRFVEVGANIGTTTVPLVLRFGAAGGLAVEPEPDNVRLLRVNLAANDLLDRVDTERAAVADREGTVRLALGGDNHGDHRLATPGRPAGATIEVPAVTLDGLVERGRIDPAQTAVVWVDVQGHEGSVLAGAQRLRAAGVPFATEFAPDLLREAGDLERFLAHAATFRAIVDLRTVSGEAPPSALDGLAERYRGAVTDLLLLP
jgi:FkbM family methyltransferase